MNDKILNLNSTSMKIRLENLKLLMDDVNKGILQRPTGGNGVNNHIHTTYSFSPYSPTKALWMAYNAGLTTAGIIDHDSISGAHEFIEAGKIIGMATTIGVECRVDFSKTILKGKRINNPDQDDIAYVTLHGIPHTQIETVIEFFKPYKTERNNRNKLMINKINSLFSKQGVSIDFDEDVVPISMSYDGGSITERHILFALSNKLLERFKKGAEILNLLKIELNLNISQKLEKQLADVENPFYNYDLLGVLKGELVEQIYINATLECPDVYEIIKLSKRIGAILDYAYLGDVGDSATGDKKAQCFEDSFIEQLFDLLEEIGFNGVSYMPSRNTSEQLQKVKRLCQVHGLFEISGEDINSPRQSFVCPKLMDDEFKNLIDSTWALIGHEKAATINLEDGMFSEKTILKYPGLKERIGVFKGIGKSI